MQEGPAFAPVQRPRLARVLADNFEELAAAALLGVIGGTMALQVCLRSFFGAPLSWPEELSQFLFVWTSILGAVGAGKRHGQQDATSQWRVHLVPSSTTNALLGLPKSSPDERGAVGSAIHCFPLTTNA